MIRVASAAPTSGSFSYLACLNSGPVPFRWRVVVCFSQKDTEEAAVNREQALIVVIKVNRDSLLLILKMENVKLQQNSNRLSRHPLKALVEEKYGIEYEEFTNPWHAAASASFPCFLLVPFTPMLSIVSFQLTIAFQ